MLIALIVCHLSALVAASPFHKYPFVFLLDVGNEELEKTNSEQIRVSAPGGSIAIRYPAIGYGNTIGHVRVSGIDFGTDLKANIVDGGPGYKYVILVFMGNPGTPYDAIVTVQTVIDDTQTIENVVNSEPNKYQSEEDENNSAEDLSDSEESNVVQNEAYIKNANAELMQSSSNVYSYVQNESVDDNEDGNSKDDSDDSKNEHISDNTDEETENNSDYSDDTDEESIGDEDSEEVSNAKDIHTQYAEDIDEDVSNVQMKSTEDDDDDEETFNEAVNFEADNVRKPPIVMNRNSYQALQDHLNFGNEVYEEFQDSSRPVYQEDPLDYEDPYAEVINDGPDKYRDSNNNNYMNSDDSYAVAY